MPSQKDSTIREKKTQEQQTPDDWTREVVSCLPANIEEQAMKLKAFERCRIIGSATDLLRGFLAYVYTGHSFRQLGMWSVLIGLADVSANDWRKRLRKASAWLDWLLQEVLAMSEALSPWQVRAGVRRVLLVDATHWKCVGAKGLVMRVHTAFDLLAGQLTHVKVTTRQEGERLEVFELQAGDLVVTDRANGLRSRIVFVLSQCADLLVRISPAKFPMEDEQGKPMVLIEWLKGLHAPAGTIQGRWVWIRHLDERVKVRLVAVRLSEQQQQKAERRTKYKASKRQQKKVRSNTLYYAGWVLLVTTLDKEHWSDEQVARLYQARWHIELLFKRIKQLLKRQTLRCETLETAKPTITALLLGWALLEQERTMMRLAIRGAMRSVQQSEQGKPLGKLITAASWWQDDLEEPLSQWMLTEACFDLVCQQVRGRYTTARFRACWPRLLRFVSSGHRKRAHLYTQVCHWIGMPMNGPGQGDEVMVA